MNLSLSISQVWKNNAPTIAIDTYRDSQRLFSMSKHLPCDIVLLGSVPNHCDKSKDNISSKEVSDIINL